MNSFSNFGGANSFQSAPRGGRGSSAARGTGFGIQPPNQRGQDRSGQTQSFGQGRNLGNFQSGGNFGGTGFQTQSFQQGHKLEFSRSSRMGYQNRPGTSPALSFSGQPNFAHSPQSNFQARGQPFQARARTGRHNYEEGYSRNRVPGPASNTQAFSTIQSSVGGFGSGFGGGNNQPQWGQGFQGQASGHSGEQPAQQRQARGRDQPRHRDLDRGKARFSQQGSRSNFESRDSFQSGPHSTDASVAFQGRFQNEDRSRGGESSGFSRIRGQGAFKRPPPRDTNRERPDEIASRSKEMGGRESRERQWKRGESQISRGVGFRGQRGQQDRGRGRDRGRNGRPHILSRIKRVENQPETIEDELAGDDKSYSDENGSFMSDQGDSQSYYSGEEEEYNDEEDYLVDDGYDDFRNSGSPQKRNRSREQEISSQAVTLHDAKPKSSLLDRIKLAKTVQNIESSENLPTKPKTITPIPPPPFRQDRLKTQIKKPAIELPPLQPLAKHMSDKTQAGTPKNKEVNSTLLAKVDRLGESDVMLKKYRLYLQKRKKQSLEGPKDLVSLVNKFETLDLVNTACFGMCPVEEVSKRQMTGDIDVFERTDNAHIKQIKPEFAIKKFTRSSADQHLDKPELLRPPYILAKTVEHIWSKVVDDDIKERSEFPAPSDGRMRVEYLDIYLFVGDRLRSVKQDIQILSSHCPEIFSSKIVITIYEQIVKFYIISCNELLGKEGFDAKINLEQLSSAFTSLIECYRISRKNMAKLYSKFNG